ncbi:MAG: phosphodiester glycosidase family protein [Planctomycetes bacterium]|nr:phosphodiester glycosidase family protein [Planctomycetota bacterium]
MTSSLLERTRRARLAVLLAALAGVAGYALWERLEPVLGRTPFEGRWELAHGVVVERVSTLAPPVTLLVARVPRGAGLRLRAVLLSSDRADLDLVGPAARRAGALVAINGDYHRLTGSFCLGAPFSTLVDGGEPRVVGAPFSYACALWLDRDGAPRIGRFDLGAALRLPSGRTLPVQVDVETGDDLLITRPPVGAWRADGFAALPLERTGPAAFRVAGPPATDLRGPALLRRGGLDAALLDDAPAGATLTLQRTGADADRVWLALGTGPRLLEAGEVAAVLGAPESTGWTARVARTAVGLTPTHVVLATTYQLPRHGLSLVDLARALAALGCTDAVNLDGGPSSTFWAGGRVLNGDEGDDQGAAVGTALMVLPPVAGEVGVR